MPWARYRYAMRDETLILSEPLPLKHLPCLLIFVYCRE